MSGKTKHLWIPAQSGGMIFHVVLPRFFQHIDERTNPLDVFWIPRRGIYE